METTIYGADVDQWLKWLDRKVELADVTEGRPFAFRYLKEYAESYAVEYRGSFSYMLDMAAAAYNRRSFSPAMVKGVLNCIRAEMLRSAGPAAPVAPVAPVAELPAMGTYTVSLNGDDSDYVTLRLKEGKDGTVSIQGLCGPNNTLDFAKFGKVANGSLVFWAKAYRWEQEPMRTPDRWKVAAEVLFNMEDRSAARLAYAQASGRCSRCGRVLTVPASLYAGMGPECASKG